MVLNSYVLKEKSLFMMLANIGWSILMVEVFYMERAEYGFKEYKNRGLIIPRVAVAGSIFMMRAAFTGIPKEMAEAARIDGLTEFGIFWKIMLPQVKPAVITLVILSVNGSWNDLLWPMIVTSSTEMRTLANGLALFIGQNTIEYGAAFAGALVSLLPMFILYMFGQKYFVEGMSSGGLKG